MRGRRGVSRGARKARRGRVTTYGPPHAGGVLGRRAASSLLPKRELYVSNVCTNSCREPLTSNSPSFAHRGTPKESSVSAPPPLMALTGLAPDRCGRHWQSHDHCGCRRGTHPCPPWPSRTACGAPRALCFVLSRVPGVGPEAESRKLWN